MAGYGAYNPYPRRYGGGKRAIEVVHESLLEDYSRMWNVEPNTLGWHEAYAESAMVACAWAGAKASHNALIATKMAYSLPTWEEAFGLRPLPSESAMQRRANLDAKMRSMGNNAEADARDASERILGDNFVGITWVATASEVVYWPGIFPGQPPFEWASNREIVLVEANKDGVSQAQFDAKVARLVAVLDDLIPAYMTFNVYVHNTNGTDDGFILDLSLLDETGL